MDEYPTQPLQDRDKLKARIPPRLIPVFGDPRFDQFPKLLRKLIRDIKSMRGAVAQYLELGAITEALEVAATELETAKPQVVCPNCTGKGCRQCRNSGYMTAAHYNDWSVKNG